LQYLAEELIFTTLFSKFFTSKIFYTLLLDNDHSFRRKLFAAAEWNSGQKALIPGTTRNLEARVRMAVSAPILGQAILVL
jgi:hypothetical protein